MGGQAQVHAHAQPPRTSAPQAAMTTHPMDHAPSDIDVDLSSSDGEGHIGEAEASQLLRSTKVYDFDAAAPNPRRMEFSPTPSPPPQLPATYAGTEATPTSVAPAPLSASFAGSAFSTNGHGSGSDVGSVKDESVDSGARNAASPTAGTPSARSRTSIWTHFTKDADYATNRRGRCVYCHNYYSCSSGSTGNMWRHIKRSHPEKAIQAAPLATHAATPQLPKSESNPRKRQASLSSPTSERRASPAPPIPAHSRSSARPEDIPHESDSGATANASSSDGLAHALRLLTTLATRPAANPLAANQHVLPPIPEVPAEQTARGAGDLVAAVSDAVRAHTEAVGQDSSRRTERAYVEFMVRDLVPVPRMLSPAMQQLMGTVTRGAAAPSASALTEEVFRQRDAAMERLQCQLDAADRVSVSISTGRAGGPRYFLAVYAHWADSNLVRHDALLDWRCVDGAATSGDIASAFEGTLTRFGLFARLGAVTTNYTREFVEFLNQIEIICHARSAPFDLDRSQATCVASTLLDARAKLLSALSDPSLPLVRLRAALQALRNPGTPGAQDLVELCRRRSLDIGALEFEAGQPWDSTVAQLGCVLEAHSELAPIAAAAGYSFGPDDWLWLAQARALMTVVDVAVAGLARLSSDFPSIVEVIPIYDALVDNIQGLLQAQTLHESVRRAGETLCEYLVQCHPFQASSIYRLAPLFDPRLKSMYYSDRGYDHAWVNRALRDATTMLSDHTAPAPNSADLAQLPPALSQLSGVSEINTAINSFIQLGSPTATAQLDADARARVFRRAYSSGRTELDDYLAAPLAAPSIAPLDWWRVHHAAFPTLAKLAREYLAISATCCAISSAFKPAPDYSQVAGMDRKLADAYMFLHHQLMQQ
ncbi:hypothetical protein IWW36_002096 [Coemansia brasiliensis]|uniref:BED-type domain-containing protein n=1 Tax=Coemansia brasiliensis TaxID=2650707 RepID=A0A9W8I8K7_9FUNG|nr:hypothetical protein IWW36_002096 [Coemansia brasiliensis]